MNSNKGKVGRPKTVRCLFCLSKCSKTDDGNSEWETEKTCQIPGANNLSVLQKQLEQIFILRELLEISEEWCCQTLQNDPDGRNPEFWFKICNDCLEDKVWKAWKIYQKMITLQQEMNRIKITIKDKMKKCLEDPKVQSQFGIERSIRNLVDHRSSPQITEVKVEVGEDDYFCNNGIESDNENDKLFDPEEIADTKDDEEYVLPRRQGGPPKKRGRKPLLKPASKHSSSFYFAQIVKRKRGRPRKIRLETGEEGLNIGPNSQQPNPNLTLRGTPRIYKRHKKLNREADPDLYISRYGEVKRKSFRWYKCAECSSKFKEIEEYDSHINLHKERKEAGLGDLDCNICTFPATDHTHLEAHRRARHATHQRRSFCCPKCEYKSSLWKMLKLHVHEKHSDMSEDELKAAGIILICPVCSKEFKDLTTFNIHKRKKHPELITRLERSQCQECLQIFNSKEALDFHINNTHKRIDKFVCETCGRGFKYQKKLAVHMQSHNKKKRDYVCEICGLDYHYKSILGSHLKRDHPSGEESQDLPTKIHKCNYCDYTTPSLSLLKRHYQVHKEENGIPCPQCKRRYLTNQALKRHIQLNHNNDEKVPCPLCLKPFASVDYMKDHMNKYCKMKNFDNQKESCQVMPTPESTPIQIQPNSKQETTIETSSSVDPNSHNHSSTSSSAVDSSTASSFI